MKSKAEIGAKNRKESDSATPDQDDGETTTSHL